MRPKKIIKAIEKYFPVVQFNTGMLYKVVLAFVSVEEILRDDHFHMKASE